MRKVYIDLTVRMILWVNEGLSVSKAVDDLDYEFSAGDGAHIMDTEITDYEIVDSK